MKSYVRKHLYGAFLLSISTLFIPADAGQRGLAYSNATFANFFKSYPKITWGYDWAYPSHELYGSLEFVPMLYGDPTNNVGWQSEWESAVADARSAGGTHLLAFNEPDIPYDNNGIDPAQAAAAYMQFLQPYANEFKLGGPAVTNGGAPTGLTWLQQFLGNCTACTIDFIPIHWYAAASQAEYFEQYVQEAYLVGGNRPIWITEFEGEGVEENQITFLQEVLPWLDSQAYVERYAYFGVFTGLLINDDGTDLSDLGKVFATT
jgi:hypothetical protein